MWVFLDFFLEIAQILFDTPIILISSMCFSTPIVFLTGWSHFCCYYWIQIFSETLWKYLQYSHSSFHYLFITWHSEHWYSAFLISFPAEVPHLWLVVRNAIFSSRCWCQFSFSIDIFIPSFGSLHITSRSPRVREDYCTVYANILDGSATSATTVFR